MTEEKWGGELPRSTFRAVHLHCRPPALSWMSGLSRLVARIVTIKMAKRVTSVMAGIVASIVASLTYSVVMPIRARGPGLGDKAHGADNL